MRNRFVAYVDLRMKFSMANPLVVVPGLDPGIHSPTLGSFATVTEWIAGSSPAMMTVLRALLL
jgi:hypothetical protein